MKATDGVQLRLAYWIANQAKGSVFLFPGRTEYVEKYSEVAHKLTACGYNVLSIDWRGQGMSDRMLPNPRLGHVAAFSDYQHDVTQILIAAEKLSLVQPWHLLAHSMGGCIGLAALHNEMHYSKCGVLCAYVGH